MRKSSALRTSLALATIFAGVLSLGSAQGQGNSAAGRATAAAAQDSNNQGGQSNDQSSENSSDDSSGQGASTVDSNGNNTCVGLPGYSDLKQALAQATVDETSGLNNQMWATIVDRDGVVCAVAFSGTNRGAQWPGSRVISAQKANTANAFSLDSSSNSDGSGQANGLALSTANLYSAVQPGGTLYGLQHSNPVNPAVAYKGPSIHYGTKNDPMVGAKIGGVNVFGGGLGLYISPGVIVGGLGVSGDTSCADHNIAWRVRHLLGMDHLSTVAGVSGDATRPDNIIYDISGGVSASGFGHPACKPASDPSTLPAVQ